MTQREYIGYLIILLQYMRALYCPRVRGDPPLLSGIIVSALQPSNISVCPAEPTVKGVSELTPALHHLYIYSKEPHEENKLSWITRHTYNDCPSLIMPKSHKDHYITHQQQMKHQRGGGRRLKFSQFNWYTCTR